MQPDGTPGARPVQSFDFNSKIFAVPGALFAKATDGAPSLKVKIGDLEASLPLPTVTASFEISGHDKDLLKLVAKGLKFAKEIRPGDSIPSEVLDGSASWAIDERHTEIARKRLTVQLVSWFKGRQTEIKDSDHLLRLADDPDVKERVNDAFRKAAESLGLPPTDRDGVLKRIEILVRELAYIEALRERFQHVRLIMVKLAEMSQIYKQERAIMEELVRVQTLMRNPDGELQNDFGLVDAHTCEIVNMLKKIDMQLAFIRSNRDDLHYKLMKWDDLIGKWESTKIEKGEVLENLMRATYRFVAQHYPVRSNWQLQQKKRTK